MTAPQPAAHAAGNSARGDAPGHRVSPGATNHPQPAEADGVRPESGKGAGAPRLCPDCNGSGERYREPLDRWYGSMVNAEPYRCPRCAGTGGVSGGA